MITLVPIPKLGQSEETVKIEKWRVKEGDKIAKGDILFEVETDKAVLEVESQFEGTLLKIFIPENKEVPVMSVAAVIGEPGEKIPEIKPPPAPAKAAPEARKNQPPAKVTSPIQRAAVVAQTANFAEQSVVQAVACVRPNPSPRARSFAQDYLIELDKVDGTGGESGRITEADVKRYLEESGYLKKLITPAAFNVAKKERLELLAIEGTGEGGRVTVADVKAAASEKPREFNAMRKLIAKRLAESKQRIPHFYVTVSVDMTEVSGIRKKLKEEGNALSVNDFIIKAVAMALKEYPMVNAESDGITAKYKSKINVGVAVSVENGLVVPVIKNADKKALDEIHSEAAEFAEKARKGKLLPDDMKGGTFTISNMGMLNVENFAAIINPGEAAILAVSTAMPTPVVRNGEIAIRDLMKVTLSADHRVVDGADAARFANSLRQKLEDRNFWIGMV